MALKPKERRDSVLLLITVDQILCFFTIFTDLICAHYYNMGIIIKTKICISRRTLHRIHKSAIR